MEKDDPALSLTAKAKYEAAERMSAAGHGILRGASAKAGSPEFVAPATSATGAGLFESMTQPVHVIDPYGALHRTDEVFAVLLKIVTIGALLFGLFEYDRQKADARVSQSLDLVEQWDTQGFQDAYARINDQLGPLYAANAETIASLDGDPAALALIYGNMGERITGRDNSFIAQTDRDVDKVFSYFERAALCADQTICDYPVLKTFFGSEAQSFWLYFARYAERRQQAGYAGYGLWTQRFAAGEVRSPKFLGMF
ncbi:MAG: hypothetical protein ABL879_13725 [Devosia sp.]